MNPRRVILLAALALLLFLGLYTWNQRTGHWDGISSNSGLEFSGWVTGAFRRTGDTVTGLWDRYLALWNVREENDELRRRIDLMERDLAAAAEDRAELARLRALLSLDPLPEWTTAGARVLGGRMGPSAALESLTLSRGYLTGARPGTPVVVPQGLVGRVFKAGPSVSVALLLTDAGSRVAVMTSRGRVQGILAGGGANAPLEMRFVRQNAHVEPGETLVTSGLDDAYPKGLPVAKITSVGPGATSMQEIQAEPLADLQKLEEVLLLERPAGWRARQPGEIYTRTPREIPVPAPDALPDGQGDDAASSPASPAQQAAPQAVPQAAPDAVGRRPS